jgi:hypothetical protein
MAPAGANIYFNIVNKQLLNVFPAPYFIATMQLGARLQNYS